jgi:ribosomal protein S12 methylthiotransferase
MKFYVKKLGCPKNDVDADYITGKLIEQGHELTGDYNRAGVIIVNTCGFILPAKEESIEEILRFERLKLQGKIDRLYVTGCLSQRYAGELERDIRGVDGFFGLGKIDEVVEAVNSRDSGRVIVSKSHAEELQYLAGDRRYIETQYPYEYLKIAEGCERYCAYCAIPYIRGHYRSRKVEDIVKEATMLADHGKKELILVSQEGNRYGRDLDDGIGVIELLQALERVEGIEWIRLMYLHPESMTDDLIEFMSTSDRVLGYFDIPLQHINDGILGRMNRRVTRKIIEKTLLKIRETSSENIIRTTFIAGLPGETDREFNELYNFVNEFRFDRMGVFKYSPEEGTAAVDFDGQVPEKVAEERLDNLMILQQGIAFEKNIALIDSNRHVIIDEVNPQAPAVGRTRGDCPEIDQAVYVEGEGLKSGDIVETKIIMAEGYDLIARIVGR